MTVECEKCGEECEIQEAKSNWYQAWCDTCKDYPEDPGVTNERIMDDLRDQADTLRGG